MHIYFSVFLFVPLDFSANQIQYLTVDAAPLITGNVLQLPMGLAVNAQTKMFILFHFHYNTTVHLKISMFVFILSTFCVMML